MFSAVTNFFDWLYRILLKVLLSVKETWVQVSAAITGCVVALGTLFSRFTWLEGATQRVQEATSAVRHFTQGDYGFASPLFGWLNFGRLVQCAISVLAATVGATVAILITAFVAIFALVPLVLGVRAILKAIRTGTGGLVDP